MNPGLLYQEGKLSEAIAATQQEIKRQPADCSLRVNLSQLLMFAGEWDRADKQLETVAKQDPRMAVGAAILRQLIRGELARQQCFAEGRCPSLLSDDDPLIRRHLEAIAAINDGNSAGAARLLEPSLEACGAITGHSGDLPFTGLRDLDDLLGPILEAITSNGKYYWINVMTLESIQFQPPEQMCDLVWRSTTVTFQGGREGMFYVPALYVGSSGHEDEQVRLGRRTDWTPGELVRGIGQREFLIGEDAISIMELTHVTMSPRD